MTNGQTLTIATDAARVVLRPDLGAALARYDLTDGREVMKGARDPAATPLGRAGTFPLVPWCNRLSDGITVAGEKRPLAANLPDQSCPIHGSGFQQVWTVAEQASDRVRLTLDCAVPEPFVYAAEITYRLEGAALHIGLAVSNRAEQTLPYGLGHHPWWPRSRATRITAALDSVEETDKRQLPLGLVPIEMHPEWDFRHGAPLPETLIDHCLGGWDGIVRMAWPERGLAVEMVTCPALKWCQIFSPGPDADFFACEPVSHRIDAPNRTGHPDLWQLAPGASARIDVSILPSDI